MVADHPRALGSHAQLSQRLAIDARVGLAAAELAFDDDGAEIPREVVALDLVALLPVTSASGSPRARSASSTARVSGKSRMTSRRRAA